MTQIKDRLNGLQPTVFINLMTAVLLSGGIMLTKLYKS